MIHYITRDKINIEKYDSCIQLAFNSRVYAFSWYLDIVADYWDALVLNDYEAVMPLPWRKKYFIKYIYPPSWTQQLGVFSMNSISETLILKFIKAIPKKFKKVTIQFNSENNFEYKNLTKRVNYVLPLDKSYEEIYTGFNTNRKRDIKKNRGNFFLNENVQTEVLFSFLKFFRTGYQLSKNQIIVLKKLLSSEKVKIFGIEINKELKSCTIWIWDKNRLTYLFSASSPKGKELGFQTYIVADTIKKHEKSNYIIDFEGSMIPGVAQFYKGFGAVEEKYFLFERKFKWI